MHDIDLSLIYYDGAGVMKQFSSTILPARFPYVVLGRPPTGTIDVRSS